MKHALSARRVLSVAGLSALALVPALALAPRARAQEGHEQGEEHEQETPLHQEMEGMKDALKDLANQLRAPGNEEQELQDLLVMERHVLAAKVLEPANMDDVPADQRPAHLTDFRRDMAKLLGLLSQLELAVLDGHPDDAKNLIAGPLLDLRDKAHDKFQKEED